MNIVNIDATNFADGLMLLGVPAVVLVPIIVEGLKQLGLPKRWATLAAVIAGMAIAAGIETIDIWPQSLPAVRVLLGGVILGFGASGVYSRTKSIWDDSGIR